MLKCNKCQGGNIKYVECEFAGGRKEYKLDMLGNIRWDTVEYVGIQATKFSSEMVCADCGNVVKKIK
jgi:hypothetical protein